jgi:hypothetical protein
MRSLRSRCAWRDLESVEYAKRLLREGKSWNMENEDQCIARDWQKDPCIAPGKSRMDHGDGTVYDWGRPKRKNGKEKTDELTDG